MTFIFRDALSASCFSSFLPNFFLLHGSEAHQDTLLSGEIWRVAQQLALRHGEQAGGLSDQHGVVQAVVTGSRRDQVFTLKSETDVTFKSFNDSNKPDLKHGTPGEFGRGRKDAVTAALHSLLIGESKSVKTKTTEHYGKLNKPTMIVNSTTVLCKNSQTCRYRLLSVLLKSLI